MNMYMCMYMRHLAAPVYLHVCMRRCTHRFIVMCMYMFVCTCVYIRACPSQFTYAIFEISHPHAFTFEFIELDTEFHAPLSQVFCARQ